MTKLIKAFLLRDDLTLPEVVDVELSTAGLASRLGASAADLRGVVHGHTLFIGVATGAQYSVQGTCPDHSITLRGPTLIFRIKAPWRLQDIMDDGTISIVHVNNLMGFLSPEEGNVELRRLADLDVDQPLPAVKRADHPEGWGNGIFAAVLGKIMSGAVNPDATSLLRQLDQKQFGELPDTGNMLEVKGIVIAEDDHIPGPHAFVLSMCSWYDELVADAIQRGKLKAWEGDMLMKHNLKLMLAIEHLALNTDANACKPVLASDVIGTTAHSVATKAGI